MPSRAKKLDRTVAKLPSIPKELVAQFLTGPMTGEAINAARIAFKQALIEASMNAELSHHLGYPPGAEKPEASSNHRNGSTAKTLLTGDGKLRIETPRDRDGGFEPLLLPKHARRFPRSTMVVGDQRFRRLWTIRAVRSQYQKSPRQPCPRLSMTAVQPADLVVDSCIGSRFSRAVRRASAKRRALARLSR